MIISKGYVTKEDDSVIFSSNNVSEAINLATEIFGKEIKKEDLLKKARITFNDGDFIALCDINEVLAEYDKRIDINVSDEKIPELEGKKCPICGKEGEIYLEIGEKIYNVCREHVIWILNQDN